MNIPDKSFKIKTMRLCYIALSLVDSLVNTNYQSNFALDVHFKSKQQSKHYSR